MTNLALSLLATLARQSKAKFIRHTKRIEDVQQRFLRSLLQAHQNTEFGRQHYLSEIKTIEQFRDRLPVQSYRYYDPYTKRMADGETNILTAEPLVYVNLSSGSTGPQKMIPVTKQTRRCSSQASRIAMGFAADALRREQRPLGKMLLPLSVNPLGHTKGGIPFAPGSTSDLRLDRAYRQIFAYPFEAVQISDTATRYYICLLFALRDADLRIIAATFPVLAVQMCDYLENYASSLIDDLETGEIAHWLKLEPDLRLKLERQWHALPERAAHLRHILKTQGRLVPKDAWTDLSFIVTARGGTSNFYFERFPDYFGDVPIFGGTYACAEGVIGVHRDFNKDGSILAIDSGFFEFIPEDQWDVEYPKTLLPWEVQTGDRYRIVMSNYTGFYRYDLGDVVKIDGFFEQTPLVIFQHRRGGVMSSSTEKTTEFHAIQVMQILQQTLNIGLEEFCLTLSKESIPAPYLVNIELASGHTLQDPKKFLQLFDDTLKEVHTFYGIKRRDQIPLPRLRILEPGSFAILRQRMLQQGMAEAQLKLPHVSEDRDLLKGLPIQQEIKLAP
ncbi:MAG: GH3 auxin-responsive promoter family protein [Oculatellaceae cyanobacterium bins.114]|nr:GH3 auxin-responsive promoter family protein [Oculatellaceae cyanobacterium bins.114]